MRLSLATLLLATIALGGQACRNDGNSGSNVQSAQVALQPYAASASVQIVIKDELGQTIYTGSASSGTVNLTASVVDGKVVIGSGAIQPVPLIKDKGDKPNDCLTDPTNCPNGSPVDKEKEKAKPTLQPAGGGSGGMRPAGGSHPDDCLTDPSNCTPGGYPTE